MNLRWLIVVCLLAAMTFGCGPSKTKTGESDGEGTNSNSKSNIDIPTSFTGDFNPNGLPVGVAEGSLAPEIQGNDLDGASFKLSDYRGKVVMLEFWGDW
jgi:hypothetical protein